MPHPDLSEVRSPMAEAPPDPQPVQQLPREPAPILQEGRIQGCQGYLTRRTKFLKRWKKRWFSITPGKQPSERLATPHLQVTPAVQRCHVFILYIKLLRATRREGSHIPARSHFVTCIVVVKTPHPCLYHIADHTYDCILYSYRAGGSILGLVRP